MKKDKRANRYSLTHFDILGNKTTIKINYNGKDMAKLPLATIDRMTTAYESEKEFIMLLMKLGYDFGHLYIEYRANGETKYINVAYADNQDIAKESTYREEEIAKGKEEPKRSKQVIELAHKLIHIQKNLKDLWSYLQRKRYISSELAILIATYNYLIDIKASEKDILDYQLDIIKEVGKYRVFRDIFYGMNEYTKQITQKEENGQKPYVKKQKQI